MSMTSQETLPVRKTDLAAITNYYFLLGDCHANVQSLYGPCIGSSVSGGVGATDSVVFVSLLVSVLVLILALVYVVVSVLVSTLLVNSLILSLRMRQEQLHG